MGVVLHFPGSLVVWKGNEVGMVEVAALAGDTAALFLLNKNDREVLQRINWLMQMSIIVIKFSIDKYKVKHEEE